MFKNFQEIIEELTEIYSENKSDSYDYLQKARNLKAKLGIGFAISYCWFYSIPQKWTYIEHNIFEISKKTQSFNLDLILEHDAESLALIFKPLLFSNELSKQFLCFSSAIKEIYGSWDVFKKSLESDDVFSIFRKIRKYKDTRLTFKNLAAMISFVGFENKYPILDTHVARFLGINRTKRSRFVSKEKNFNIIFNLTQRITTDMSVIFPDVTTINWSLAVWFNKAKLKSTSLLNNL